MAKRKTARAGARTRGRAKTAGRGPARSTGQRGAKRTAKGRSAGKGARAGSPKRAAGSARKASAGTPRGTGGARSRSAPTATPARSRGAGSTKTLRRRGGQAAGGGAKARKASSRAAGLKKTARPRTGRSTSVPPRSSFGKRGRSTTADVERDRRLLEETVETPPSSLDFDSRASAARTGRAEMQEALDEHTETGPALTGGDVDADWESAYATGDEAPGGDMPTPDQSVVQDIGVSVGVEYEDNEELKGVDKIERRDRHRWEYDPASSEDYQERTRKK